MKYNEHTGIPFIILTIVIFVGMVIAFTHLVMWVINFFVERNLTA
jgi:hypothetical protein